MPNANRIPPLSSLRPDVREQLKHVRGRIVGDEPGEESEHSYSCSECGQAVDRRSLYQVLHHEEVDHEPMSEAELAETSPIDSKGEEELEKQSAKSIKAEDQKRDAFASGKKRFTEGK